MTTTTINVTGMTCGHCVGAVTEAVSKLDGVKDVQIDLPTGAVTITSDEEIALADLREAVDEAGYEIAT